MPGSEPEGKAFGPLSQAPTGEELARHWTLAEADRNESLRCRGEPSRRRFAVQLCVLRSRGRFLEPHEEVPIRYVNHVGLQLGMEPVLFADSPLSEPAETAHRERICKYLGYSRFDQEARDDLEGHLLAHAAEASETDLLARSREFLRQRRIVLPGLAVLRRIVNTATTRAEEEAFQKVAACIPPSLGRSFDALLETGGTGARSRLFNIKDLPDDPVVRDMLECLDTCQELDEMGLDQLDLDWLHPRQAERFYLLAERLQAYDLRRLPPARRHATLACFLVEARRRLLDHLVKMNEKLLARKWREARNSFEKKVRTARRRFKTGLCTARSALAIFVDPPTPKEAVLDHVYRALGRPALEEALAICMDFEGLEEGGIHVECLGRLPYLNRYLPRFYRLPMRAEPGSEALLDAMATVLE